MLQQQHHIQFYTMGTTSTCNDKQQSSFQISEELDSHQSCEWKSIWNFSKKNSQHFFTIFDDAFFSSPDTVEWTWIIVSRFYMCCWHSFPFLSLSLSLWLCEFNWFQLCRWHFLATAVCALFSLPKNPPEFIFSFIHWDLMNVCCMKFMYDSLMNNWIFHAKRVIRALLCCCRVYVLRTNMNLNWTTIFQLMTGHMLGFSMHLQLHPHWTSQNWSLFLTHFHGAVAFIWFL